LRDATDDVVSSCTGACGGVTKRGEHNSANKSYPSFISPIMTRWESRLLIVQGVLLLFVAPVLVDSWVPRTSPVNNKAQQQPSTTLLQGATDTASDKSARTSAGQGGGEDGDSPLFLEFVEFLRNFPMIPGVSLIPTTNHPTIVTITIINSVVVLRVSCRVAMWSKKGPVP
jgi:hypothetical protein